MRNFRLILEYDGTDFCGFQRQLNKRTVQGELERSLSKILREPIKITGAGRTDAGVHAAGQVANFLTSNPLPLSEAIRVFNAVLPIDLAIRRVDEVALDFHSRRMARSRIYRYTVLNQPLRSARLGRFAGWVERPLALEAMNEACAVLLGEHDFAAFQAAGSPAKSTFRRLMNAACKRLGDIVWITIEADAFLYQMVRIIVSSLIAVGTGERPVEWMEALLKGRERSLAPAPAAAQGLCLMKVTY